VCLPGTPGVSIPARPSAPSATPRPRPPLVYPFVTPSFKGLALLNAHLSGKSFASLERRLDCITELLHSHGVDAGTYVIHGM